MSLDLAGLMWTIEHNIAQHDALDERAKEMNEREEKGDFVRVSEWEYLTDDRTAIADSHYDVLAQALEFLKAQPTGPLHAVYFATGDYDSALIFRDADEADRVAALYCERYGEGYAWTDWVTVQ